MSGIYLYIAIIKKKMKSQLEYKANVWIGFFNQFFVIFFEFLGVWALLGKFGNIDGWNFSEVFLTYGIVNLSFSMAEVFMRGFESDFVNLVRNGEYDRYLLRPRNTVLQVSAFSFQFVRLGRAVQSFIVLITGILLNSSKFDLTSYIILLLSLAGGISLYFSLYMLIGILTFRFLENTEFMSIFVQGSTSTMQYPKTIFPKWIQALFTYVLPVTAITYYPVATIFNKTSGALYKFGYFSPLLCFLLFLIVIYLYKKNEKQYVSSGS